MLSIFTSTMVLSMDQSTSNDRLKPVMTASLVNMHIDRSIADLDSEMSCVCIVKLYTLAFPS